MNNLRGIGVLSQVTVKYLLNNLKARIPKSNTRVMNNLSLNEKH